jgi:phenylalanyl-tRNA synthetase beta chain
MRLTDTVKGLLVDWGGLETATFSFIRPAWLVKLRLPEGDPRRAPIVLRNPLGEDTGVMRTTLAASLLWALANNQSRKAADCLLFETGAAFETIVDGVTRKEGDLPYERQTLCVAGYGATLDFYETRGIVEAILTRLRIPFQIEAGAEPYHHPGRACRLVSVGKPIARLGQVHPEVCEAFDLQGEVYLAELDLDACLALQRPMGDVRDLPKYPAVDRDIALVLPMEQPLGPVRDVIAQACGDLLEDAALFDVYRGEQLVGRKSAAFALRFRAADRTLTDEEVSQVMARMLARCAEAFGAEIRQ